MRAISPTLQKATFEPIGTIVSFRRSWSLAKSVLGEGLDRLRVKARQLPNWALLPLKRVSKLLYGPQKRRYQKWLKHTIRFRLKTFVQFVSTSRN